MSPAATVTIVLSHDISRSITAPATCNCRRVSWRSWGWDTIFNGSHTNPSIRTKKQKQKKKKNRQQKPAQKTRMGGVSVCVCPCVCVCVSVCVCLCRHPIYLLRGPFQLAAEVTIPGSQTTINTVAPITINSPAQALGCLPRVRYTAIPSPLIVHFSSNFCILTQLTCFPPSNVAMQERCYLLRRIQVHAYHRQPTILLLAVSAFKIGSEFGCPHNTEPRQFYQYPGTERHVVFSPLGRGPQGSHQLLPRGGEGRGGGGGVK